MGWTVLALGLAAVAGTLVHRYSARRRQAPIPTAQRLAPYLEGLLARTGLDLPLEQLQTDAVTSDGYRLHLDLFPASETDPVVVFVPGTAVYALVYAEFMHGLSRRGFNVIGFDPRGHGRSQGLRGSYTVPELVRDTEAVIRYARKRYGEEAQIFVAGSSQGGIVAFYTAARGLGLQGAVCHNLADLTDPDTLQLTRTPMPRFLLPVFRALARLFPETQVPISAYLDLEKEETALFGNAGAFLRQDPLALTSIALKALVSLASTPLPCPLESYPVPVMILHAEHDNIFPLPYIERIFGLLPEPKRLHVAPDRPHLLLTDHVDEMLPEVERWLRDCSAHAR